MSHEQVTQTSHMNKPHCTYEQVISDTGVQANQHRSTARRRKRNFWEQYLLPPPWPPQPISSFRSLSVTAAVSSKTIILVLFPNKFFRTVALASIPTTNCLCQLSQCYCSGVWINNNIGVFSLRSLQISFSEQWLSPPSPPIFLIRS